MLRHKAKARLKRNYRGLNLSALLCICVSIADDGYGWYVLYTQPVYKS